jgi:hypothetical protein
MLAHKTFESLVSETSLVGPAKSSVQILYFWSRFEQLDEALKVVKIQVPAILRIGLLSRSLAIANEEREGTRALKR